MDLYRTLFSPEALASILRDGHAELAQFELQKVSQHYYCSDVASAAAPPLLPDGGGGAAMKPKTPTEFRATQATKADMSAVEGRAFHTVPSALWERQYLFFFFLYTSANLRKSLAEGSPKKIYTNYLRTFRYRFERHISGMHNPDVSSKQRTLLLAQSPLLFVTFQVQLINTIYCQ